MVSQPSLAQKMAGQINEFTRARLSPDFLRQYQPDSRRTRAKLADMALIRDAYKTIRTAAFSPCVKVAVVV